MTATIWMIGEPILMIVEDDPHYARVLVNLARERGFKVLLARTGADALHLRAQVPAGGGLLGCVPARYARLDRAQPAQAQQRDPAHPGADPDHRG